MWQGNYINHLYSRRHYVEEELFCQRTTVISLEEKKREQDHQCHRKTVFKFCFEVPTLETRKK